MKALHEKVNIVPLIAKADCLVPSEIRKLKERVSLAQGSGAESTRCADPGCHRAAPGGSASPPT